MTKPDAVTRPKGAKRPLIMGVVNATPDSFHESSRAQSVDKAVELALRLVEEGADILDIGGQSTRPGSEPIPFDVERERVIPVIKTLAKRAGSVKISVDTDKARIAEEALDAGATIINDVSAMRADKGMVKAALRAEKIVLMHMLGTPGTMQANPSYKDCFQEVYRFLEDQLNSFVAAGGRKEQVWVDPGIGFGKTLEHNLTLIRRAGEFSAIAPVVLGVSRKSMFGKISPDNGPQDRLAGSLAVAAHAAMNGMVSVLRVHDVLETNRTINTLMAISENP